MSDTRAKFIGTIDGWATRQPRPVPYIYGAKDPDNPTPQYDRNGNRTDDRPPGADCSGCYGRAMVTVGIADKNFPLLHNAQWIANNLAPTDTPDVGDCCCYGKDWDHVDHVMAWVGDGRVIGASGAGSDCITPEQAFAKTPPACVHYEPSVDYRDDFLGYRSLPVDGIAT